MIKYRAVQSIKPCEFYMLCKVLWPEQAHKTIFLSYRESLKGGEKDAISKIYDAIR